MTAQRCRTCRWWCPADGNEWGTCRLTTATEDETRWKGDEQGDEQGDTSGHPLVFDHPDSLARVEPWAEGEYCGDLWCGGSLNTAPNFGCVQWQGKEGAE